MQRILITVNSFPPKMGGLEKHVENLAKSLLHSGNEVTVLTVGSEKSDITNHGLRVITIPGKLNVGSVFSFPPLGTMKKIKQLILEGNITAVSTHTRFFPMTWLGIKAAQQTGTVSVITEHGSNFVSGVSPLVAFCSKLVDKTLGKRALQKATIALGISQESVNFVKQLSGREATLFPNAIDTNFWSEAETLRPDNLVFVGRIVNGKGWLDAIRAFEQTKPHFPNLRLHIFGNGPQIQSLEAVIRDSSCESSIQFHGAQPQSIIRKHLAGSIFLNPTTLSEGFQTTLLEAAVARARIVSYPVPGISELKNVGVSLVTVENFDTLSQGIIEATKLPSVKLSKRTLNKWGWGNRAITYLQLIVQAQKS